MLCQAISISYNGTDLIYMKIEVILRKIAIPRLECGHTHL
jgi:hypothetical protein